MSVVSGPCFLLRAWSGDGLSLTRRSQVKARGPVYLSPIDVLAGSPAHASSCRFLSSDNWRRFAIHASNATQLDTRRVASKGTKAELEAGQADLYVSPPLAFT